MNFRQGPRAPLFYFALLALLCCCGVHRTALGQSAGGATASAAPSDADKQTLKVVVLGDSIMWGQGLDDRYKFRKMVQRWLEEQTGRKVEEHLYAHAGAVVEAPECAESEPTEKCRLRECLKTEFCEECYLMPAKELHGEVNVSYPTIQKQVETAVDKLEEKRHQVELVLMDGCINDINFRNLLDVTKSPKDIEERTTKKCGEPMGRLLDHVTKSFPKALVVVTGYYPLIYAGEKAEEGENGKKGRPESKGTANNALTRAAIRMLGSSDRKSEAGMMCAGDVQSGCEATEDSVCFKNPRQCLHPLSEEWYETSNEVLAEQVRKINRELPETALAHVVFAELNYPTEFAFSTPQSMLWNIRFGATNQGGLKKFVVVLLDGINTLMPNDEQREARVGGCKDAHDAMKLRLKGLVRDGNVNEKEKKALEKWLDDFKFACKYGSLGHPNKYGAALYAQAIIGQLKPFLYRFNQPVLPQNGGDATPGEGPEPR